MKEKYVLNYLFYDRACGEYQQGDIASLEFNNKDEAIKYAKEAYLKLDTAIEIWEIYEDDDFSNKVIFFKYLKNGNEVCEIYEN